MQSMRGGHPGASSSHPPPPPPRPRLRPPPPPPPRPSHQETLTPPTVVPTPALDANDVYRRECTGLKMKRKRTCHCSRSGSMHCPTHIPYHDLTETIDMIHLIYI
ncbi:hypothetical protein Sjap_024015 [Stephania japonica]|uniref:Uncharacterized protein n=1 Tax=Stephania japonica TaxID=461633 RepID=A0AAP0HJH5_9MAGN